MIKNTHKVVTDYAEAYGQAHSVYNQAVKHIRTNYKEGGELYTSAMKTAQDTLTTALKPMQDTFKETVKNDFDEVRKAIRKAVAVSPSADVIGILPLIREGKLNSTEIQIILEAHKGNYMDSKMIHDAMGEHFTTVESVMGDLDSIEQKLNTYFKTYAGETLDRMSYNNALILNGSIIGELDTLTDDFLNTYGVQVKGE